ncbi:MAG TPA: hypothetical protein DIC46_00730 [Porphyromonadaceae bacterium]|nr:hypothetical protein [Porphyromonadaceae bacterium]
MANRGRHRGIFPGSSSLNLFLFGLGPDGLRFEFLSSTDASDEWRKDVLVSSDPSDEVKNVFFMPSEPHP